MASCFTNRFRDKGIFSFFFWWNVTNCKLPHFLTYLRQSASCRVCWWIFPPNSSWLRDYEGGPRAGGAIKSHFEDTIPSITLPTHTVNVVWGGLERQHKALVSRILQQNEVSLVFWPTEGHIYNIAITSHIKTFIYLIYILRALSKTT